MHTVRGQFAHVWCAETTGKVQTQVEVVADVADGTNAARQSVEVTLEIHKAHLTILHQLIPVQSAIVVAQTSIESPAFTKSLCGSSIDAEVEETVVRNQILLTLVTRLLIHTANTR